MPFTPENSVEFDFEYFNDDDDDDSSLVIKRTRSYSTRTDKYSSKTKLSARQTTDTASVNQAIACALKSRSKAFHYTQKHLQYLPPSIKHLELCDSLQEFDLHANELQNLPDEISYLKSIVG